MIGQSFSVLAAPLLKRLYSPEQFGVLATYAAVLMLGLSFTSMRYNVALSSGVWDAEPCHLLRLRLPVPPRPTSLVALGAWAMDRQVRMTAGSLVLAGVTASKLVSPKFAYLAGAVGAGAPPAGERHLTWRSPRSSS